LAKNSPEDGGNTSKKKYPLDKGGQRAFEKLGRGKEGTPKKK